MAILVSEAALDTYSQQRRLGRAEAHRELLGLLVGRELRERPGRRLLSARARSRTLQIDVGATISLELPVAVVVAVSVKPYL